MLCRWKATSRHQPQLCLPQPVAFFLVAKEAWGDLEKPCELQAKVAGAISGCFFG